MIVYTALTGGAALAIGGYLVVLRGEIVGMLLAAGGFFVLFYTFPLKFVALGEPAVLPVWGPLMVGGSYYVITGEWSNNVAVASIAYALGPTAVLEDPHHAGAARRIRLPLHRARHAGRAARRGRLPGGDRLLHAGHADRFRGRAFAAARVRHVQVPAPPGSPAELPKGIRPLYFVAVTFWYNRRIGMFFPIGLIGDIILSRV